MVSSDILANESDILFANIFYKKLAWVFMGNQNQKPYCEKGMISARSLLTRKGLSLNGI